MLQTTFRNNVVFNGFKDFYGITPFMDTENMKLYDVDGVVYANFLSNGVLIRQERQIKLNFKVVTTHVES